MRQRETNQDASILALQALSWIVSDESRASRFLALTGIDPADLRARAGDPSFLTQVLVHLESYEPDLLACADALDVPPAALVQARTELENA